MTTPEAVAAIVIALAIGAVLGYWWGRAGAFREASRVIDKALGGAYSTLGHRRPRMPHKPRGRAGQG